MNKQQRLICGDRLRKMLVRASCMEHRSVRARYADRVRDICVKQAGSKAWRDIQIRHEFVLPYIDWLYELATEVIKRNRK